MHILMIRSLYMNKFPRGCMGSIIISIILSVLLTILLNGCAIIMQ